MDGWVDSADDSADRRIRPWWRHEYAVGSQQIGVPMQIAYLLCAEFKRADQEHIRLGLRVLRLPALGGTQLPPPHTASPERQKEKGEEERSAYHLAPG
jgi:hypothetical protein